MIVWNENSKFAPKDSAKYKLNGASNLNRFTRKHNHIKMIKTFKFGLEQCHDNKKIFLSE